MKNNKRVISKLYILIIFAILAVSFAGAFTARSGIEGKYDVPPREFWYFRFGGSGVCVIEEDGFGTDDQCCVSGYLREAVLQREGRLSDITGYPCSDPDGAGDNPNDVLALSFGGPWGFGRDVLVTRSGAFVLCDEVNTFVDSDGRNWRCDGTDFFDEGYCSGEGSACGSDGDCCSGNCGDFSGTCKEPDDIENCAPLGSTRISGGCGLCGQQRQVCTDLGSDWDWVDDSCINQGVCSPGTYRCSGDYSQLCSAACSWNNNEFCNDDYWDCSAGDVRRDRDRYCNGGSGQCAVTTRWSEDCDNYNYNGCSGDTSQTHDYTCASGNCQDNVVASQNCNLLDGWYCVGSTAQNRNYGCSSGNCNSYSVTSSENCDSREANYCSSNRYYRDEWGCSNGVGCSNLGDTAIGTNSDGDSADLECGDSICDNNPSYVDANRQCNAGQTQCASGRYQGCSNCAWANQGTNADGDSWDSQCGDSVCDNAAGVSDATRTVTETLCADGLDNDCDGITDCADSDCAGGAGPSGARCCQNSGNCVQDDCVSESCVSNTCQYSNRGAGDTTECGTCQSCNVAGGDCMGITASDGKNCANTCTSCSGGSCTNRALEDNTECATCNRCTGSGGDCVAVTAETGKNCVSDCFDCSSGSCVATTENNDGGCTDDCTRCNAGTCTNRNACDGTECTQTGIPGTSEYCNSAGGDCRQADSDSNVCTSCVPDQTVGEWIWSNGRPTKDRMTDAGKAYSLNDHVTRTLFNSAASACAANCNQSNSNQGRGCACYVRESTSTAAMRIATLSSGNCCGDDANEWLKTDYFGGECVSASDICIWSDGHAQPPHSGNSQWWCNPGDWYECNNANIGAHDPPEGMCCAGVIDSTAWTPQAEVTAENTYSCTDGKDNDCDGQIDCDDTDCAGSIGGYALNQNNMGIFAVFTNLKKGEQINQSINTDAMGKYNYTQAKCGTYSLTTSHPDYWPVTINPVIVNPNQAIRQDINMLLGTSCEADCTYVSDDTVHAGCDSHQGCTFYDATAKAVCDNSKVGWLRDYNSTHYIICASGIPQSKVEVSASLSCSSGTIVKVTRIVSYNGRPVKLVVATCG